jgi:polar amino acid transport system permease protein
MDTSWISDVVRYGLLGLTATLWLSGASTVLSIVLGTVLGIAASILPVARSVLSVYSQIWRGLPVLVTLFMMFFLLPQIGITVSFNVAAIAGLALWGSANIAEIVLGAIQTVPAAQLTAARALAFGHVAAVWYVILPQAIRRMLPSSVGILVSLIQATSLASAIGVVDLLEASHRSIARLTLETGYSHAFPIYATVLVVYFIICYPLSLISRRLERRLG